MGRQKRQHRTVKLLCISDERDPLIYSPNIKERFSDVDAVIGAGDLPMNYYSFIVSMLNKPLYFIFGNHQLAHLRRFMKPGNEIFEPRDCYETSVKHTFEIDYFGSTYIDGRVKYLKKLNLIILGIGGSPRYNDGDNQFTELQIRLKLIKLFPKLLFNRLFRGRWLDLMITHAPPRGIHDQPDPCHRGFCSFLWFMRVFKPRYLLHGHVHLLDLNEQRETQYEETRVINVFQRYLLEVET